MCGRFVDPNLRDAGLDTSWLKINPFPRRHNVKPTQDVLILAKPTLEPLMARWRLVPSWFRGEDVKGWKATTFNARIEEAWPRCRSAHRLEACRKLGWAAIPASIFDLGEQQQIIAECDENLCAPNLSASERAVFTARREAAYEALHPETQAAAFKGNQHVARSQVGYEQASFAEDQSSKTGRSETSIRRDAERGSKVCQAALDVLKGTKADTGAVLDRLKDLPMTRQVEIARQERMPTGRSVALTSEQRILSQD